MESTLIPIALVLLVAVVIIGAAVVWSVMRRKRHRLGTEELRGRFGPEYDRALHAHGDDPREAERELRHRVKAVEALHIRPLSASEHAGFARAWEEAQHRFVDDPRGAVGASHELIKRVMHTRGYPVENFDSRVDLLSVDHGDVVRHYRAARTLAHQVAQGEGTTEDLRQAMVHYRALFGALLTPASEPRDAATGMRPSAVPA